MTRAPAATLLLVALGSPAPAVAAEPPAPKPLATAVAPVSPPSGVPFMNPAGSFAFDTGPYLLGGTEGLTRARGFFTMGFPGEAVPYDSFPAAGRGHRLGKFGHRHR